MSDILKIQKTVRKSIKDYAIESSHSEDALVAMIWVDLYLALEAKDVPPPTPKVRPRSTPASASAPDQATETVSVSASS